MMTAETKGVVENRMQWPWNLNDQPIGRGAADKVGGKYTEGKTPDKGENNSSVTGPEIIY